MAATAGATAAHLSVASSAFFGVAVPQRTTGGGQWSKSCPCWKVMAAGHDSRSSGKHTIGRKFKEAMQKGLAATAAAGVLLAGSPVSP
jgi:hypothetical protein